MVCLTPVDEDLEPTRNSVGIYWRADNKKRCAPDGVNDVSHIIIKDAGTGIVALVAPYA